MSEDPRLLTHNGVVILGTQIPFDDPAFHFTLTSIGRARCGHNFTIYSTLDGASNHTHLAGRIVTGSVPKGRDIWQLLCRDEDGKTHCRFHTMDNVPGSPNAGDPSHLVDPGRVAVDMIFSDTQFEALIVGGATFTRAQLAMLATLSPQQDELAARVEQIERWIRTFGERANA